MTNSVANTVSYFAREVMWLPLHYNMMPRQIHEDLFIRHHSLENFLYDRLIEEIVRPLDNQLKREISA